MTSILILAIIAAFWVENVLSFSLSPVRGLSLMNLMTYLLIVVWAAKYSFRKKLFLPNNINKYIVLMIIIGVVSVFNKVYFSGSPNMGLRGELIYCKNWADPMIIFIILFNIIEDEKTCRNSLWALIAFLIVTALTAPLISLGIIEATVGPDQNLLQGRASGGFGEPNQYAAFIVLFFPLILTFFLFSKAFIARFLSFFLLLLCFTALVITGSRGGAISFAFCLTVYFLSAFIEKIIPLHKTIIIFVSLFIIGLISFAFMPSKARVTIVDRFNIMDQETLEEMSEGHGRLKQWEKVNTLFWEKPVFGYGQNSFRLLCLERFGKVAAPHNNYLKHVMYYGIIGLGVFVLMLTGIFTHTWKNFKTTSDPWRKSLYMAYIAGFCGYHLSGMAVDLAAPRLMLWIYTAAIYKYIYFDTASNRT